MSLENGEWTNEVFHKQDIIGTSAFTIDSNGFFQSLNWRSTRRVMLTFPHEGNTRSTKRNNEPGEWTNELFNDKYLTLLLINDDANIENPLLLGTTNHEVAFP